MSTNLALAYRPRDLASVVGQKAVQVVLRQLVLKDEIPAALVFSGPRGTGKTSTARIVAAALNCEIRPAPCGSCASCLAVFAGSSLDVLEVDAASNGLVDNIRQINEQVQYAVGGKCRVVLLDEAHSMSNSGFNALLKILEEPPPNVVFILLTTEINKIPETILSRCMDFGFTRVSVRDIIERMQFVCDAERLEVEPELVALIAERADGGMRDALMVLDQYTRVGVRTVAAFEECLGEVDFAPTLFAAMAANDLHHALTVVDEQMARVGDPKGVSRALARLMRDLTVLQVGGTLTCQGQALAERTRLAGTVSAERLFASCQLLWDFAVRVQGGDPHGSLFLLIYMLTAKLATVPPDVGGSRRSGHEVRKLSLADMQAYRAR